MMFVKRKVCPVRSQINRLKSVFWSIRAEKKYILQKKVLGKILHIVFKWKHNEEIVFQIGHTPAV
jgi:hypothetical protein